MFTTLPSLVGGIAGLTFGLEAARRGKQVAILESSDQVGGLARTLIYCDYRFDIGGHRFHSDGRHIADWALELMDGEMLQVIRRSLIYLNGRWVDHPLEFPNALLAFNFSHCSARRCKLSLRDGAPPESCRRCFLRRLGSALIRPRPLRYLFAPVRGVLIFRSLISNVDAGELAPRGYF